MTRIKYKRVLLKLSGEAFKGERDYGIDPHFLLFLANEIKSAYQLGIDLAIVIGGGNIFRGLSASENGMDRVTADYTGMLATIMNALALQDALSRVDVPSRVQSALHVREVAETFILQRSIRHMEKGRIVIFAGGTGNPYFTTDTTAALRAAEIKADVIFKATKVDGVYDKDPMKHADAQFFESLTYQDVLTRNLHVMDTTALTLSQENNIPIVVFNLSKEGNIQKALLQEKVGTYIGDQK